MSLDFLSSIGGPPRSKEADVLLDAIMYQESDGIHVFQKGGTARGLWQFEKIAVKELFRLYPNIMLELCKHYHLEASPYAAYMALSSDDNFARCLARLLLYKDKRPLPDVGEIWEAWTYYIRNWRPGRPRKEKWFFNYQRALKEQLP